MRSRGYKDLQILYVTRDSRPPMADGVLARLVVNGEPFTPFKSPS